MTAWLKFCPQQRVDLVEKSKGQLLNIGTIFGVIITRTIKFKNIQLWH
jgi:hypothetical protein